MLPHTTIASTYAVLIGLLTTMPAAATPFLFSTGDPDGKMATASRPSTDGKFEIESADDFVLTQTTSITNATFTGLLTGGATVADIGQVVVEIYRVFPKDSDVGRTSGPPTFSTSNVPTRVNTPSDNEFHDPDIRNINVTVLAQTFTSAKSVQSSGNPIPGLTPTGGNGPVVGEEVEFDVDFTAPFLLPPDHYFLVPHVEITTADGEFLWLSAPRPIVSPGTSFPAGFTDLQSWTRDEFLDPDWLRVGTDIVGGSPAPTFNAAFSLTGTVPEPVSWSLLAAALAGLGLIQLRRGRARP
jgi:hypothetical protein